MGTFIATVKFRIDGVNDEQEVKDIIKEASDLFQENSIYPYNTLSEPLFEHIDIAEEEGRASIRHRVSALLMDTDEDHQIPLSFPIGEWDEENCGLSSLDLPWAASAYQIPGDGTIWIKWDTANENYSNFDDLDDHDIVTLAEALEEYHEKQGTLKNIYITK